MYAKSSNGAMAALLLLLLQIFCFAALARSGELQDKLRDDPELSQDAATSMRRVMRVRFYSLLEQNPVANSTLSLRACTIFVPTNEAFQRHHGPTSVLYHIATVAMNKEELLNVIPSDEDGNPPLYITKNRNGDTFVNNARIIPSLTVETNSNGKRQVMHIIDEVLVPLTTLKTAKTQVTNPDALLFLQQAKIMDIGENNRVGTFRQRVAVNHKDYLYQSPGAHTFLVPIDDAFKKTARSSLVDKQVIDAHVIPNNVVFTSASQPEMPLTTAAFEDNIKVTVDFYKQNGKMYVQSKTLSTSANHSTGLVVAQIVKANIPVRNGVVHLIHKPLMIIDTDVKQYLEENQNGALSKFFEVIMDMGGDVMDELAKLSEVTILAPNNDAWNASSINNIIRNREKMREILNMHIIRDRLGVDKIRQKNANMVAQIPTLSNRTFLYFNINGEGSNAVITVEGGGVNATLLQPDVAQTNGYVHVIDKVLGVPYSTVLGKLQIDPMMSDTYKLGQFSTFNDQLNNTQRRYTYFVPYNKGWQKTKLDIPSAHKKLFMRDFAYHSKAILERHLVIADRVFTMKDLLQMSIGSDSVLLPTFRDSLKLTVHEESGHYQIMWNYKKIHVYRPDVECTNGIIHVIDYPFLEEKDVVVSGGSYLTESTICIMFANFIMIALAKFLI